MSEVKYKKILQTLFYITLFSPLIVDRRLFYPYVTGMALYFRLIVETMLVLWLIFIFLYPKYRPKLFLKHSDSLRSCPNAEKSSEKANKPISLSLRGMQCSEAERNDEAISWLNRITTGLLRPFIRFAHSLPRNDSEKWRFIIHGNYLLAAVLIYLAALGAATYFSVNPYLSFWGDAERMMGLFGILHFFALFLIGTSLFKEKKEWRGLLIAFTAASLAVCCYGILQRFGLTSIKPGASRILATMGNAGILAAYLIFGLFFSAYLVLIEQKNNWRWIFGASAIIHLIAIIMTGTRGAYLGVAVGLLFGGAIMFRAIFRQSLSAEDSIATTADSAQKKKRLRNCVITAVITLVLLYSGLYISRDQDWVKNNLYLNRLTAFSLNDVTVKTRVMSWRWGLAGWRDKPILGYGLEQFAVPYNKYFQAEYYNYAAGDTYFDRAHNIVVELLATTGVVGLLSYVLLLLTIFYTIYKTAFGGLRIYKSVRAVGASIPPVTLRTVGVGIPPATSVGAGVPPVTLRTVGAGVPPATLQEDNKPLQTRGLGDPVGTKNSYSYLALFGGLLIAYFIQNLFIFDLLPAMIGFMVLLIIVNANYAQSNNRSDAGEISSLKKGLVVPIALILFAGLIYACNNYIVKPYKALIDNVAGQVYLPPDYNKGMEALQKSVSYRTPLDLDLRSAAANTIFNYYRDNQVDAKNIKSDIDFAINLYKENLKYLPEDLYYNYKIAEIMDFRFAVDLDEKIIKEARPYIDKAIFFSPGRAELYYIRAENLLMDGKMEEAVAADQQAVSLNDKFGQSYWELAKVCYEAAKYDKAKTSLVKAIDLGYRIQEETLISLKSLFNLEQSVNNEIEFLELIIKNGTKNYLIYSTLANKYYEIKEYNKAIKYAEKSAEINPEVKDKVEKFIKIINSKQ